MLDIKFVRENPEVVKQNIRNKFQDSKLELVDKVLELDKENREIKQEVEALRAERNKISKQIGALMMEAILKLPSWKGRSSRSSAFLLRVPSGKIHATRSLQVPFTASMQMKPARNLSKKCRQQMQKGNPK